MDVPSFVRTVHHAIETGYILLILIVCFSPASFIQIPLYKSVRKPEVKGRFKSRSFHALKILFAICLVGNLKTCYYWITAGLHCKEWFLKSAAGELIKSYIALECENKQYAYTPTIYSIAHFYGSGRNILISAFWFKHKQKSNKHVSWRWESFRSSQLPTSSEGLKSRRSVEASDWPNLGITRLRLVKIIHVLSS